MAPRVAPPRCHSCRSKIGERVREVQMCPYTGHGTDCRVAMGTKGDDTYKAKSLHYAEGTVSLLCRGKRRRAIGTPSSSSGCL